MKNIIQAIKDCHSARINCCACGAGERVYFIPESIISKLEVVVAKMETTTSTCKDSLQVGDIAAMRGALENARSLISEGIETEVKDDIRHPFHLELAIEKINEALSTPPRNCDLFGGDPKMLYTAWFDWTASPSGTNDDGTVKLSYGEWLLERAKGGAHANR
jgi:hypothetical protein